MWADDLVLFSESDHGLNSMLDKLSIYNEKNKLELNIDKTKCLTFNKTGRLIKRIFKYRDTKLEIVREFKYLGFLITPSGEITTGLHDLKDRAGKSFFKLKARMGEMFYKHILTSLKLFDTLLKPILLYMSDFWGCLKMPKNNPIEIFQNKFLKQLLGVQIQTTNIGVLLETGSLPLSIFAKKMCIGNWSRITRDNCNKILQQSYQNMACYNLEWHSKICEELSGVGLFELFITRQDNISVENIAFKRFVDIFHQNSFAEIKSENSKLRTYGLLKTEIGCEKYLSEITSVNERRSLTKFRLSNDTLMIKKGRHLGLEKKFRLCKFCSQVEDELHFLIKCKTFEIFRQELFKTVQRKVYNFTHLSEKAKFLTLLINPKIMHYTCKYVHRTLEIREFLIKEPKNNI